MLCTVCCDLVWYRVRGLAWVWVWVTLVACRPVAYPETTSCLAQLPSLAVLPLNRWLQLV